MLPISRSERDKLEKIGLLKSKRDGISVQDPNYSIANRRSSKSKTYFLVENPTEMRFLGYFIDNGICKISKNQYDFLIKEGSIEEDKIQIEGTYVPQALCYYWGENNIWVVKDQKIMIKLGYWKIK